MNGLTHWIDGSQIYGNNPVTAQNLRDTSSGRGLLKISLQGNRALLPVANTCCPGDPTNSCAAAQFCFFAGIFHFYISFVYSKSFYQYFPNYFTKATREWSSKPFLQLCILYGSESTTEWQTNCMLYSEQTKLMSSITKKHVVS